MANEKLEVTSVRRRIQATMDRFSNGEKKVARALLAKYPSAALTTAADLATSAGVSQPTVVRFVARLGFEGFASLQRALVREMNSELGSPLRQYETKPVDQGNGVLDSTLSVSQQMIATTYSDLPTSEFETVADLLADTGRNILVTGGRFSGLLAEYIALHLNLMRPGVAYVGPGEVTQRAVVVDSGTSTIMFMLDFRRYAPESLRLAEAIADTGATVCLMTDPWMSPIARCAKVVLPVQVESASPFDSILGATAIAESLIAAVNTRLGDAALERLRRIEALREHDTEAAEGGETSSPFIT